MEKLSHNDHIDLYRHLAFCAVGGFFGGYAILVHSGIMGNAQTVNLIELLMDFLRADGHGILLHTGALVIYILGTMLTVLLPHWFGADTHLVSPFITAAAAVTVSFLPPDLTAVIALYPIFFWRFVMAAVSRISARFRPGITGMTVLGICTPRIS